MGDAFSDVAWCMRRKQARMNNLLHVVQLAGLLMSQVLHEAHQGWAATLLWIVASGGCVVADSGTGKRFQLVAMGGC